MEQHRFENEKQIRERLEAQETLSNSERELLERLQGKQPTLNLGGQLYYVNYRAEYLERQGTWMDIGIKFDDLEDFYREDYSSCDLPYNCKTHQVVTAIGDLENLLEMPKDILIISIPPPHIMDRVGYARNGGGSLSEVIRENPQIQHFEGKVLNGKDNWLEQVINRNRKQMGIPPLAKKNTRARRRSR